MRYAILLPALLSLLLASCMHDLVHQGNRLGDNKANLIRQGDTKFTIEQKLGSPALNSMLHPNRVTYFEEFEDKNTGELHKRGVEITYDDALRAREIRRFGFDNKKQSSE